jgi:hypothetical protein
MDVANTLAYFNMATITGVQTCIVQALGPDVMQLFTAAIYKYSL